MKPLIEKLTLTENTSFVARTYRTPKFEVPWHQHIEFELILFTEGEGVAFIGNGIHEFKTGDIFFLGSNLPHTFQKADKDLITSAVVVQFREDIWGHAFLQLPENRELRGLFATAEHGMKINGHTKQLLRSKIQLLEGAKSMTRLLLLYDCLHHIAVCNHYETISTQEVKELNVKNRERIDTIFQYTIEHFQESVSLPAVAGKINMSVPAFCNYFKKSTKKTYIDFLNELRIGYACQQLMETQKPVMEIAYESGFNTLANFNRQFRKVKLLTPSTFRKKFRKNMQKEEIRFDNRYFVAGY